MPTRLLDLADIAARIERRLGTGGCTDHDTSTGPVEEEVDDAVATIRLRITTDGTATVTVDRPGVRVARSVATCPNAVVSCTWDDTVLSGLHRVARPVQAGRPVATERLERVLLPGPEPVRRQRDRMKPGDWIALASLIVAVVTYVTGVVTDAGGASVRQLVTIIEELARERSEQSQPLPQPTGATGPTTGTDSGHGPVSLGSPRSSR